MGGLKNMLPTRIDNPRSATLKKVTSVARRTPVATTAEAQRLPFRVLQTSHAPAQLSLFLRPVGAR
jgi:hypothetical protein